MVPAWTQARALFLGLGVVGQDMAKGLRMARACEHPDAVWLASLFPEGAPASSALARDVLQQQGDDPRAQCFAALLSVPVDMPLLLRAAQRGNALAMAVLGKEGTMEESGLPAEQWTSRSAELKEPRGLCELGTCSWFGWGCPKNKERALQLYREAADLGDADAQLFYAADAFGEGEPQRYVYLGRAAAAGSENAALVLMDEMPRRFDDMRRGRARSAQCLFELGAAFRDHLVGRTLFDRPAAPDKLRAASRAVALHAESCERAQTAIEAWLLVARRKRVVRDMRRAIAKMLWASRAAWAETNSWKRPRAK